MDLQKVREALVAIAGGIGPQIAFLKKYDIVGPRLDSGGPWDQADSYFGDDFETQARWNMHDRNLLIQTVAVAAHEEMEGGK